MGNKNFFLNLQQKYCLSFVLIVLIFSPSTLLSGTAKNISLSTYKELAIPVPNPMDLTTLPPRKTYQVTDSKFILQFFYDGKEIYGFIFKRDRDVSVYIRWCFFRSCEESPFDYNLRIADAFTPPYDQTFFTGEVPAQMKYQFQGLKFFTFR